MIYPTRNWIALRPWEIIQPIDTLLGGVRYFEPAIRGDSIRQPEEAEIVPISRYQIGQRSCETCSSGGEQAAMETDFLQASHSITGWWFQLL